MMDRIPAVVEVEASGFGAQSYPIEVGFVDEQSHPYCFLVEPQWNWTDWDAEAQAIHGIDRKTLKDYGKTAYDVAEYMNGVLHGKTLYSDTCSSDELLIAQLFHAVDFTQQFKVASLMNLLTERQKQCWLATKQQVVDEFDMKRHRASNDAKIVQETYKRVVSTQ